MSQDFEHAFAISMHIPKFVFNLESVSMYKSGSSSDYSNNDYRVTSSKFRNTLMLSKQCYDLKETISVFYFFMWTYYFQKWIHCFFEKTHSALNPTRVGILSSKPCCDVALHPSASWEESTMGWNVFMKSSISRDIYDDLYY